MEGRLNGSAESGRRLHLWTWQKPDFDLTTGRVDHSQSEYYNTVGGAPAAYARLHSIVGTDQLVWCTADPEAFDKTSIVRIRWELMVPEAELVCCIDDEYWNRVLGTGYVPHKLIRLWDRETGDRHESDVAARNDYIEEKKAAYLAEPGPPEGWWNRMFISDPASDDVSVLIRHPVPTERVIDKQPWFFQ